jgi:hypothetical protein
MSRHINKFIDSVKAHESRGTQQFTMSLRDAKDLHADITKLLLVVNELRDKLQNEEIITVEVSGKAF